MEAQQESRESSAHHESLIVHSSEKLKDNTGGYSSFGLRAGDTGREAGFERREGAGIGYDMTECE